MEGKSYNAVFQCEESIIFRISGTQAVVCLLKSFPSIFLPSGEGKTGQFFLLLCSWVFNLENLFKSGIFRFSASKTLFCTAEGTCKALNRNHGFVGF